MKLQESGLPFDDFRNLVATLPPADEQAADHTLGQLDCNPTEQMQPFEEMCAWYSRWSGRSPVVHRPLLTLFAGTHVLQNELDDKATALWILDEVLKITEGTGTVNRLCKEQDFGLKLFDLALQIPVDDISKGPALDEKGCAGTIAFGMEAIAGGSDLLGVAALEDPFNPSSLAILSLLNGLQLSEVGLEPEALGKIKLAAEQVLGHEKDGFEVLRRLGGRETAAIAGAILAARSEHVPTIVGGVTGLAACAALYKQYPQSISHCIFAQSLGYPAFDSIIVDLGLKTVLPTVISDQPGASVLLASSLLNGAFKHVPLSNGVAD